jgi:hypothetical protein
MGLLSVQRFSIVSLYHVSIVFTYRSPAILTGSLLHLTEYWALMAFISILPSHFDKFWTNRMFRPSGYQHNLVPFLWCDVIQKLGWPRRRIRKLCCFQYHTMSTSYAHAHSINTVCTAPFFSSTSSADNMHMALVVQISVELGSRPPVLHF